MPRDRISGKPRTHAGRANYPRPFSRFLLAAAANSASPDTPSQTDARLALSPALAQLRPRDRQLLWLAHAENYSHREIAEITGLAATSIRLLLFRARRQMAQILQKGGA